MVSLEDLFAAKPIHRIEFSTKGLAFVDALARAFRKVKELTGAKRIRLLARDEVKCPTDGGWRRGRYYLLCANGYIVDIYYWKDTRTMEIIIYKQPDIVHELFYDVDPTKCT